jgi:succinate dehydrogenase / fumarate reductase, cytochrome b subunit
MGRTTIKRKDVLIMSPSGKPVAANRPLSPHLQVYNPQLTSVLSITHRLTGVFLSFGALVLVLLVYGLAFDDYAFGFVVWALQTTAGAVLLVAWVFAFYYHLSNGIRHLFWDMGRGFELKNAYASGYAVVVAAALLTAVTFGVVHHGGY